MPQKTTEDICVFAWGKIGSLSKEPITYYPQGLLEINISKKNNPNSKYRKNQGYSTGGNLLNSDKKFVQTHTGYPNNILKFGRDKGALHPTQKPVALFEYLVKTYTIEGATVLDNCIGSGTTAIACLKTNRQFIGIERNSGYYEAANERIKNTITELKLDI